MTIQFEPIMLQPSSIGGNGCTSGASAPWVVIPRRRPRLSAPGPALLSARRRRAGGRGRAEQLVGGALLLLRQAGVKRFERRHQPLQIVGFGLRETRRGAQAFDRVLLRVL